MEDPPFLYHNWNSIFASEKGILSFRAALMYGLLPTEKDGPDIPGNELPPSFREAKKEGQLVLSLAHFTQMKAQGDSPWMKFQFRQLMKQLPRASTSIITLDGITKVCGDRYNHYCARITTAI